MNKFEVTLKSGVSQIINNLGGGKNPVGLWIWSTTQSKEQILTFMDEVTGVEVAINSREVAMIVKVDSNRRAPYTQDEEDDMYIRKYKGEYKLDN